MEKQTLKIKREDWELFREHKKVQFRKRYLEMLKNEEKICNSFSFNLK